MSAAAKKHYESGLRFLKNGKLENAEAEFAEAIALDEQNADYWLKLGTVWTKQSRHTEARDAHEMAATLAPTSGEALLSLGLSHIYMGDANTGLPWIEKAFTASPSKKMAEDLGDVFAEKNDWKLAGYYYLKAYKIDDTDAPLQAKLALALYNDGDSAGAATLYIDVVLRNPTNPHYMSGLADIYRKLDHNIFEPRAKKVIQIALKTENVKYRNFAPAWTSLFLLDPDYAPLRELGTPGHDTSLTAVSHLLADDYLNLGLKNLPLLNMEAEKTIERIRRYFLLNRSDAAAWPPEALTFLTSLAVQCWYNDYVFYETAEEIAGLRDLEPSVTSIAQADDEGSVSDAMLLALYACYRPLYTIKPTGKKLPLSKSALYELRPLLKAQVQNPEREQELIPTIPAFTEITDTVSRAVQDMYAQRPYPRWKSTVMDKLRADFAEQSRGMNILVAGCGTGQEPAIYAHSTPFARVTAIDLSLPSIAYGKRMAAEIGYAGKIDFMHGDLMDVAKIGRTFDLVVSSGVLHHMKDPVKGLEAILSTLKRGGRLNISLYSQIARDQMLNPASDYIKSSGYSSSDQDIRQFRHDVMNMPADSAVRRCTRASDFYMLSECNDLLFHVQEHRFTCLTLKAMTEKLGLELFHVFLPPKYLKLWQEKYPDAKGFDLEKLHVLEEENPAMFLEMYKMYFYRCGEEAHHPLDPLIYTGLI